MTLEKGLVVKAISGFYYILPMKYFEEEVNIKSNDEVVYRIKKEYFTLYKDVLITCKGRGVFKNQGQSILVGDLVRYDMQEDNTGIIVEISDRKNSFIRPPVSNIDTFVIVVSATLPKANTNIIDKFIVMALKNGVEPVLCINKVDDVSLEVVDRLQEIYGSYFPFFKINALANKGFEDLCEHIKGKKVALAGPSGVGKSTIINRLNDNLNLETGEVSSKNKRGRNTTRHVEMFPLERGGFIFDTPGFTAFDIKEIKSEELRYYFPEMKELDRQCQYADCKHLKEPKCKVIESVEAGKIHISRYESYKYLIDEITLNEKQKY